jgi:uncharacterized repeat protein (TIGR03806 family)
VRVARIGVLFVVGACSDPPATGDASVLDGGGDARLVDAGSLLTREPNTTCRLPHSGSPSNYVAVPAFPSLPPFDLALWVGTAPGDDSTMFVVEQDGVIHAFDNDPEVSSTEVFLRISPFRNGREEGLLGLAFHPDYADNGRFFIAYSSNIGCPPGAPGAVVRCNVVSELRRESARRADPTSERRLLVIGDPFANHNGGDLRFGPDGLLYIAMGDGGSAGDPQANGQNTHALLAKILRIDVDSTSAGRPYGIPGTNPFADGIDGAPEVYVWGVRNPWRTSIDRVTGALWIGDVGQARFEEVNKVFGPTNLGWDILEGDVCYPLNRVCSSDGLTPALYAYGHEIGRVVVGGNVYRGPELRELWGVYVYADFNSGRVYTLREREGMPPEVTELFTLIHPSSFGEDNAGRLYIATFQGSVMKLARALAPAAEPIPELLSETGCFTDTATHAVAPGVVPYDLAMPLWSDGAEKLRFVALPELETATPAVEGAYSFPIGTLFLKTFALDGRRIETRILSHEPNGWRGFTWRWNEEQTDAVLLDGPLTETIETEGGALVWSYPSRVQCEQCHTREAGQVLGFRTRQLNRVVDYDGTPALQLEVLRDAGFFDADLGSADALPAHPRLDDALVSAEDRARAYLDVNCAMCHRFDGTADAAIDLRIETAFADTGLCDALPLQGDLEIPLARLVSPGSPETSVLHARVARRGPEQMPPLASAVVDPLGEAVIAEWIRGLSSCPTDR